jgi:CRISPR associated protein
MSPSHGGWTWKFARQGETVTTVVFERAARGHDPTLLRRALTHGFGPAKGYGCGLLTLAIDIRATSSAGAYPRVRSSSRKGSRGCARYKRGYGRISVRQAVSGSPLWNCAQARPQRTSWSCGSISSRVRAVAVALIELRRVLWMWNRRRRTVVRFSHDGPNCRRRLKADPFLTCENGPSPGL